MIVKSIIKSYSIPKRNDANVFIESNGNVTMQAEHYSKAVNTNSIKWQEIPNLGRTGSAVTPFPVTTSMQTPSGNNPHLEYNMYLFKPGEVKVDLYFSPTLNFENSPNGIRYAISIDDEKPQVVNMTSNPNPPDLNRDPVWNKWVSNNINIQTTKHKIDEPGEHTLKFWMVDPGVVLQKIVVDGGGVKESYFGPTESFNGALQIK